MSRGRKAKTVSNGSMWEQIFNKSQGFYFEYIVILLGRKNKKLTEDNASDLLKVIKQEKVKLLAQKKIKKDKPLPEIKPEEIPFEIPSNWAWCRLDDIAEIVRGGSPRPAGDTRFYDGEIPFLKVADLTATKDIYLNTYTYTIKEAGLHKTRMVEANTLMLTNSGATLGIPKICTFQTTFNDGIAAFLNLDNLDKVFLYYFLSSKSKYYLSDASRGQGQPNLNTDIIGNTILALPPLNEQKMISDFLQDFGKNALNENREYFDLEIENEVASYHQAQIYNNQISTELNHQLALVKELRQAYLREAMQGKLIPQNPADESAEILLEKIKAEKEKLIAEKKIKKDKPLPEIKSEEIPFGIPSNWTWCKFQEITTVITCGMASTPRYYENGRMFLSARNIKPFRFMPNEHKFVDEETYRKVIQNAKPEINDILITRVGAGIGETALIDIEIDFAYYVSLTLVKPIKNYINSNFLVFWLNSPEGIQSAISYTTGTGSSQGNLNVEKVRGFYIPLPPLAEQERIVARLEKLMKFCDELEANIKQCITNADKLLQVALKEALEPK